MASVLSSGEKRIVAVLSTCYGLMIDDNIKELYIDQETTSMVDKIRSDLYDLLSDYVKHGPEVEKYSKVIDSKLKRDNRDYCISNTQLAMTLLYLSFEKCEKSFKKLPTKISEWYQDNDDYFVNVVREHFENCLREGRGDANEFASIVMRMNGEWTWTN